MQWYIHFVSMIETEVKEMFHLRVKRMKVTEFGRNLIP
jgi:hypothetical protein